MAIALKAENVSIRYITGDFKDIGLKEYTVRKLTRNYHVKEFMAVDGVSFELEQGDMLGIIGSNGAGKSTLLKAVAGIMEPTRGKITTQGEVAALLELGSGFDGDLTVKENAYLRGAMLGYTKEFMDQTYDQIIDFAELREFEDRPFKQLSSGMKSRLAFSIASLVKPDILILDEVLSVGDGAFQEKSAKKMREIIGQGATTILVSHSLSQIRELCNKVLWLDHGKQVAFGETEAICDQYERFLRGECPAEMPGEERSANEVENSCETPRENDKQEQTQFRSYIIGFDMLKGIMCILIALYHFSNEYTPGGLFCNSFLCVEAFFAIAGYLLLQTCYKNEDDFQAGTIIKRRISRLYPAYFVGIIALIALFSITWFSGNPFRWMASAEHYRDSFLTELLMLQAVGVNSFQYINYPAWYVSALVVSSIFMVLIFKTLKDKKRQMWMSMAALAVIGYSILYYLDVYSASSGYLLDLPISLPVIRGVAGMCLGGCIFESCVKVNWRNVSSRLLYCIEFFSLLGMFYFLVFVKPGYKDFVFLILLTAMMIAMVGLAQKEKEITIKPLLFLGKISYWFFIMHSFSQNIISIYVAPHVQSIALLACVFLAINLVVSGALYFLIDGRRSKKLPQTAEKVCNQYESAPRKECAAEGSGEAQPESSDKVSQVKEPKSVLLPEGVATGFEQRREKSGRVASIEGMRGILALIIALFHFGQAYPVGATFHRGYFAVEVFFMLSGFLLAKKLEKTGRQISLRKDLMGRLKRLYPAYFVSVLALVMLYSAVWFHWNPIAWIQSENSHLTSLIAELLCIQVSGVGGLQYINGPVWYVSALLLSTIIIILLFKLLPTRFFKVIIAGATAVIYALFFIYDPSMNSAGFFNGSIVPSPLLRGVAGLGLGCCLYWIYHRYKGKLSSLKGLEFWAVISCYLLVLPMIWTEPGKSNFLLFIPASVCILTMFWLEGNGKFPILTSKPVQYLGKISCTFFVMQSFSQNVVSILISKNIQNHVVLNVIYLALNLLLSTALYLAVEWFYSAAKGKNASESP